MENKKRFIFVDLLRGWALLVMIEVHVFNSMLQPSLKHTGWFYILNFINGLVAPSFLFISGFAFTLSTNNKTKELRKFNYKFWKKLGRIVLIFLAGYSLHLPILSLRRMLNFYSPEVLLRFYNVDILQCIGAGLLILLILKLILKSEKIFTIVITVLMILIFCLSPVIWQIKFTEYLIKPIAAYFNPDVGSLFPLFPWLGFLFAGAVTSQLYLNSRKVNQEQNFIFSIFTLGLVFIAAGQFFLSDIFSYSFRMLEPQPVFAMERLGYVLVLLALCWYYSEKTKFQKSIVLDVGRESLLIYWLHLQIIYREFWNGKSLEILADKNLTLLPAIGTTITIAFLMIIVARYWGNFKKKHKEFTSRLTFVLISLVVIIFLIGF